MDQTSGLSSKLGTKSTLQTLYAPRTSKLIVMSITTLGVYLVYWGYKNWSIMRASQRTQAWAPICGFFLPFTLFPLLGKIEEEAKAAGASKGMLNAAAICHLLICLFRLIPLIGILGNFLVFLPLLPINRTFARINAHYQLPRAEYEGFTLANKLWLTAFSGWFTFHLIKEFMERA